MLPVSDAVTKGWMAAVNGPSGRLTTLFPTRETFVCGRIVQKSGPMDYVERIFPNPHRVFDESSDPRYRVSPAHGH